MSSYYICSFKYINLQTLVYLLTSQNNIFKKIKKVLILCTGTCFNGRGLFHLLQILRYIVQVLNQKSKSFCNKAMEQIGIDISENDSNHVDEYVDFDFDYVFTVCDNVKNLSCLQYQSKDTSKLCGSTDAKGTDSEQLAAYVEVRDQLSEYQDFMMKNIFNR